MKVVSIDTGDPNVPSSVTAFVKIVFKDDQVIIRDIFVYSGTFKDRKQEILDFVGDADHVIIEQIDATNKFLSRSVIAEQLALREFLHIDYKEKTHELIRSGRKQVITDKLLQQIHLYSENGTMTNHHDVREATRNLLYFMAKSKDLNKILSNYVQRFFK